MTPNSLRFWQRQGRKPASATIAIRLDRRALYALAALLFLSQLPHIAHLPIWVSILGAGIVLLKLLEHHKPSRLLSLILSPIGMTTIALGGALMVRAHYGYFMGRDPCVAFLFILVSAKFAEVRKPSDSTLLLCLAGFLLLTQYFYSQSILSALITLPAVLALGNALAVIRDSSNAPPVKQNIKMVGKLLLQGAPLALLLFVVFPRLPGPMWSLPDDASAKTGLSDSMAPGSIGNLSRSDEVAFRVEFDGAPPPPEQRYWRGPVLSDFDGRQWTIGDSTPRVRPSGPTPANASSSHYTVMMQATHQRWLFALDHPISLPMSDTLDDADSRLLASMTADLQLKTDKPITQVLRYEQSSSLGTAYKPIARPGVRYTQLSGKNQKTLEFASQLRAQTGSDRAYANAVMNHFRAENFHYTLQPSLLGDNPVDEFLFSTRNGFCEHYSSAFVVLMRAAAIPARVVTGYLGGEMNGDYMIVRQSDAHAWTEVYLEGQWVRFDPTGAVAPSRVDTNMAAALGDGEPVPMMARQGNAWLKSLKLRIDEMNHDWQRLVVDFNNESQYKIWEKLGLPKLKLWQITVLVLFITGLWCMAVLGFPVLGRSGSTAEEQLWQRYLKLVSRYGVHRQPAETPGEFIERAENLLPGAALVRSIGDDLTKLRFTRMHENQSSALKSQIRKGLNKLYIHSLINRNSATTQHSTS